MAAEVLAEAGVRVTVYERMGSVGRKFLLAGRGGLNITHSEPLERFLGRYGGAEAVIGAVTAFPPGAMREWCAGLGEGTFVGSSGRVFPASFKATPLLRAWLRRLGGWGSRFGRGIAGWAGRGRGCASRRRGGGVRADGWGGVSVGGRLVAAAWIGWGVGWGVGRGGGRCGGLAAGQLRVSV